MKNFLKLGLLLLVALPSFGQKKQGVSGTAVYGLTRELLAIAPKRFNGSPGHAKAEQFIQEHFAPEKAKGNFEQDSFTARTPAGMQSMNNYIAKFKIKI